MFGFVGSYEQANQGTGYGEYQTRWQPIFYVDFMLMVPTIIGIMLLSFVIIQFAPGGPIERIVAQLQGHDASATSRFAGGGKDMQGGQAFDGGASKYRGAQGLDPEFIAELENNLV